jgi:hypothetical protein
MINIAACSSSCLTILMLAQSFAAQVAFANCGGLLQVEANVAAFGSIYYWQTREDEIWLLTVYGRSEQSTIAAHILRKIAEEIDDV